MADTFDFIVVGGGTAGCLLARRLADTAARPSVLLVEAGTNPEGDELRPPFLRYAAHALRPDLDYQYETTPQKALNDRVIPYPRGKGLGGSSVLNFQVYLYGSGEDYNKWAELVGDDDWKWENTKKSFKAIENYEFSGASAYPDLAKPDPKKHGTNGLVKVCLPPQLEKGVVPAIDAIAKSGERINLDFNSGNPMGIGIFPQSTSTKDGRTTSATAHLLDAPKNLVIWTNGVVHKLAFEGKKVVGIETVDGRKATTSKEVILCSGSFDTPRLLLLNGIGPAKELEALNIPIIKDLPGVGKHLHDHVMTFLIVEVDGSNNDRYAFESNEELVTEAQAMYKKDQSGTFALHHGALWGGFLKLPGLEQYEEFQALDQQTQEFLSRETVPAYEFIGNCLLLPGLEVQKGNSYISAIAFLMNAQSEGSVTLRSSDPQDKPVVDVAFLTHPYDRRAHREGIRATWTKLFENPVIKKDIKKKLLGPESLSDEDIDAFMKDAATTVWHANGSVKMGKKADDQACVDSRFRVYGVEGLRVADLSVCPLTPNNHTQATAYLVGQKAAERLVEEYRLAQGGSKL
ncbi:GMC oxidoreductase [Lentithecium fluviatile CBS 122367]|uniref:GMC oxidoreductase n=1 Tax=Lentithecium fluviatile CBS 122367 TaxID=1168545 RepID=A0A6G1JDF2_9PLEO|nr:GMC oxidoreductase [Lentithecium fluviatile CBS 122367]